MRSATLVAIVALTGCGSLASNSDVPTGIYTGVAGRPTIADSPSVKTVDSPSIRRSGGAEVFGTSCKNKIWEPEPSKENAIALMKRQAADLGMNVVYSVSVQSDATALLKNCWSAITAAGKAFKEADPSIDRIPPSTRRK